MLPSKAVIVSTIQDFINAFSKAEEEERGKIHDIDRWIAFVANNLLAYTAIFQQLLPRFMRTDLVAPKNALMLFRVTKVCALLTSDTAYHFLSHLKIIIIHQFLLLSQYAFAVLQVFSQPYLAKMISEVESCMDDVGLSRGRLSTNQWTSIVRQQILELEGPTYQYVPMFSPAVTSQVFSFLTTGAPTTYRFLSTDPFDEGLCILQIVWFLSTIKQAHLTATSLIEALENRRKGRRFLFSLWQFFYRNDYSSDDIGIEERQRVPLLLANAQQQLIDIFQVNILPINRGLGSHFSFSVLVLNDFTYAHDFVCRSNLKTFRRSL